MSLNLFKLLNKKCERYFGFFENEGRNTITLKKTSDKERFGFYFYILENVLNIKDFGELQELITDTDFNLSIGNEFVDDYGVDAIHIDDETNTISMFNFKFRENYKQNKQQVLNDVLLSTKFTSALLDFDVSHLKGKVKEYGEQILEKLNSKNSCIMKLYVVSNECFRLDSSSEVIKKLEKVHDLEVIPIALPDIENFLSIRPEAISSKLVINKDAVMSYTEGVLSSDKSYIIRLAIPDLIRITCNKSELREDVALEDYNLLGEVTMDYAVLFDNVRGFLGQTKFNRNIERTLKEEPTKFFMFNNGITMTATNIKAKEINGKSKLSIEIEGIKVVNGGQTLRTIHNFSASTMKSTGEVLNESEILVRIFQIGDDPSLLNNIAEYTNSQNSISSMDLKSLADEQILLEQYLDEFDILYARKNGDVGKENKEYRYKISMEKFAQLLFSKLGFPERASNQKRRIFDKYYDFTFKNKEFKIENSLDLILSYYNIQKRYKEMGIKGSDQKIFYIIYLEPYLENLDEGILLIEEKLISFVLNDTDARKLINANFKKEVFEHFDLEVPFL